MRRALVHSVSVVALVGVVVTATAGVSSAKSARRVVPTLTTSRSSSKIAVGVSAVDSATVTGTAAKGSPTGSVTFSACGPTTGPTPCTAPNIGVGSVTVGLTAGARHRSTAAATISPGSTGWFCFLDQYSGDARYKAVKDNDAGSECLDVTGSSSPSTPTLKTALSSPSIALGSSAVDTATVIGNATGGSPTGSVTFTACGPTASALACTSPNFGPTTVGLSSQPDDRSTAAVTISPGAAGWYCFLDQYNGDTNYTSVSDNDPATECLDVTGTTLTTTPTITSALNPSSIAVGGHAIDVATVTGDSANGPPTGTVSFSVCGPTATAVPCTSPNLGPATAELGAQSSTRSVASATIYPGGPGWYCFLDQYSGDANYSAVSDNDASSECLDVTGTTAASPGPAASVLTAPPGSKPATTTSHSSLTPVSH